jgi:hypothetical protein
VTRFHDWQGRLEAFLSTNQFRSFHYGRWDCCLFVCDAIEVMTGVDPAAVFRGTYSSRVEARRAVRAYGGTSVQVVVEAITAQYGMPEAASVLHARRGDAVLIKRSRGRDFSLGLVALNGREVVLATSMGLWRMPVETAIRAWHV